MSKHPDGTLTLRQAFDKHYDTSDMTRSALTTYAATFRAWEALTDNPPICEIDDETLAAFRQAGIDKPYSPTTVNTFWSHIRATLRRMGPKFHGNPRGLRILDDIPWMKLVRIVHTRPRFVSQAELEATYLACGKMRIPKRGVHAPDWWRALLTVAYLTGLRKGDIFSMRWEQIDFENLTLDFTSRKTGKADVWPLHPIAAEHLKTIKHPKRLALGSPYREHSSTFYTEFRKLRARAGVDTFGLHDLRRTAASQLERISPGLGPEFLQHVGKGVSDLFYLNRFEQLRDALQEIPIPVCMKYGSKILGKVTAKHQVELSKGIPRPGLDAPRGLNSDDWQFRRGQFCYRGKWFDIPGQTMHKFLRKMVSAGEPVHWTTLCRLLIDSPKSDAPRVRQRVRQYISLLRRHLREALILPECWDPVPCIERGEGGTWTIHVPTAEQRQRQEAG